MAESLYANFDEIDIALYHLNFIGNDIENTYNALNNVIGRVHEWHEKSLWIITTSWLLIRAVAFLDEYDNFVKLPDEEPKGIEQLEETEELKKTRELRETLNKIKKAAKPALKQIREWKGLTDFRNHVLAHNLRDKNLGVSVLEKGFNTYDVPKSGYDLMVFYNCLQFVKKVFQSAFAEKLRNLKAFLDNRKEVAVPYRFNSFEEAKAKIDKIAQEINNNILELKKSVGV